MKIYYGLTEEESKLKTLIYNDNNQYDCKGVNTSLEGLIKFIKDNNMENIIKYYTVLDSNIFDIKEDIILLHDINDYIIPRIDDKVAQNSEKEFFKLKSRSFSGYSF